MSRGTCPLDSTLKHMIKISFLKCHIAVSGNRDRSMVMCDHCSLGKLGHVTKLHDIAAVAFKEAALRRKYFFAAGEQLADLDGGTVGQIDMGMLILRFEIIHVPDLPEALWQYRYHSKAA